MWPLMSAQGHPENHKKQFWVNKRPTLGYDIYKTKQDVFN